MSTFRYSAYGADGALAEGSIEAASMAAAADLLWGQGLSTLDIRPQDVTAQRWWNRDILVLRSSSRTILRGFTRELATLMAAEIPLDDALRILSDPANAAAVARLAADLRADLLNGAILSDAMERRGHIFPNEFVSVVRAGEVGGTVREVIGELAELLDRRAEMRGKVQSALVYPALLVGLAIVSLAVILGALMPSISSVFAGSGKPLPGFIGMALAVQAHGWEILTITIMSVGGAIVGGRLLLRRPSMRSSIDRLVLRLPVIGTLILAQETARFALTLGTLLKSGVPLLQAASSGHKVICNTAVEAQVERAMNAVSEGSQLHRALVHETSLPPLALRLIATGEEAGRLDRMLLRVATVFEQSTRRTLERAMTLLAPALTMIVAGFVGALIIAVMDAVMTMNSLAF